MKRNGDVNNNPIFIIALGLLLSIIGVVFLALLVKGFNAGFLVAGLIFTLFGSVILVFGILRNLVLKKYKQLLNDASAYETDATFIKAAVSSYTSKSVGIGNIDVPTSINVYKKITYSYIDETGVKHTVKSVLSYTPNQVEFLKSKRTFRIKCRGNLSAIIEVMPEQNKRFNI